METKFSFSKEDKKGKLYLVPTPIGNLSDMTPRAISILEQVDLIAAEDTRNTAKLLNYFKISKRQISFHEHNKKQRIPKLVDLLLNGKSIAQVSDAGMPSISDPGHELVVSCIKQDIAVIPLPGPSAAITAIIASGLAVQPFIFFGFLSRKVSEQKIQLEKLKTQKYTLIFYESPHRLKKTLQILESVLGNRRICLCRELTKRYEEFLRGTLKEAVYWAENETIRGEFVIVVSGDKDVKHDIVLTDKSLIKQVSDLIDKGLKTTQAIKEVAKNNNLKKQVVYNKYHNLGD